jgi:hypothetical protein
MSELDTKYLNDVFAQIKLLAESDKQLVYELAKEDNIQVPQKKGGKCPDDAAEFSKRLSTFIFIIGGILALIGSIGITTFCTSALFDILRTVFHIPNAGELFESIKKMIFLCRDVFSYSIQKVGNFAKYLVNQLVKLMKEVAITTSDFLRGAWNNVSVFAKLSFESLKTVCALAVKALAVAVLGTGVGVATGIVSMNTEALQSKIDAVKTNLMELQSRARKSADATIAISGNELLLEELNKKLKESLDAAYAAVQAREEADKAEAMNVGMSEDVMPTFGVPNVHGVDYLYEMLEDIHTIICYNIDRSYKSVTGTAIHVATTVSGMKSTASSFADTLLQAMGAKRKRDEEIEQVDTKVAKTATLSPDAVTAVTVMNHLLDEVTEDPMILEMKQKWSKVMQQIQAPSLDDSAQPKILTTSSTAEVMPDVATCSIARAGGKPRRKTTRKPHKKPHKKSRKHRRSRKH